MPHPPRILFASPWLPYKKASVDEDNVDYFYYRNTFHQGIFQLRQMASWHPLHFLAQNLPVESVVLENPTRTQFEREVASGGYDVVAISFTVILARKVLDMVTWLRERHPHIEIVLGGYGTVCFDEDFGIEKEIERRVDHICRGEGLAFMRAYLRERWGITGDMPMRQDLVPVKNSFFRSRLPLFEVLVFVGTLGCDKGCSFCATSAYFDKQRIRLVSGAELYGLIRSGATRHPKAQSAMILEEDFLADRERVLAFMAAMEADRELQERPFLLTVFASIRSLSQYTVAELVRCGIGTIFIGVESFRPELLAEESLEKRGGRPIEEVFQELHDAGIGTLASMILGWDGHTPENIRGEMDRFVALSPTFYQVVPLHPAPGTRLWKRIKQEGRILPDYRYEDDGMARTNFRFKHFELDDVHHLVSDLYDRLVEEGGPWPFRTFQVYYAGWRNLAASEDPILATRGRACRKMAFTVLPLAMASRWMFPGHGFQNAWHRTLADFARDFPLRTAATLPLALGLVPALGALRLLGEARHAWSHDGDQPETIRREYPREPAP